MNEPFSQVSERLLDKSEVAQILGVSPRTIDVWLARRAIPHIKLGSSKNALVRFRRADIDSFLNKQAVVAVG